MNQPSEMETESTEIKDLRDFLIDGSMFSPQTNKILGLGFDNVETMESKLSRFSEKEHAKALGELIIYHHNIIQQPDNIKHIIHYYTKNSPRKCCWLDILYYIHRNGKTLRHLITMITYHLSGKRTQVPELEQIDHMNINDYENKYMLPKYQAIQYARVKGRSDHKKRKSRFVAQFLRNSYRDEEVWPTVIRDILLSVHEKRPKNRELESFLMNKTDYLINTFVCLMQKSVDIASSIDSNVKRKSKNLINNIKPNITWKDLFTQLLHEDPSDIANILRESPEKMSDIVLTYYVPDKIHKLPFNVIIKALYRKQDMFNAEEVAFIRRAYNARFHSTPSSRLSKRNKQDAKLLFYNNDLYVPFPYILEHLYHNSNIFDSYTQNFINTIYHEKLSGFNKERLYDIFYSTDSSRI